MQLKMTLDQHCYSNELYRFDPRTIRSPALNGFAFKGLFSSKEKKCDSDQFMKDFHLSNCPNTIIYCEFIVYIYIYITTDRENKKLLNKVILFIL